MPKKPVVQMVNEQTGEEFPVTLDQAYLFEKKGFKKVETAVTKGDKKLLARIAFLEAQLVEQGVKEVEGAPKDDTALDADAEALEEAGFEVDHGDTKKRLKAMTVKEIEAFVEEAGLDITLSNYSKKAEKINAIVDVLENKE